MAKVTMKWKMYDGVTHSKVVAPHALMVIPANFVPEESDEAKVEKLINRFFKVVAVPATIGTTILAEVGKAYYDQIHEAVAVFAPDAVAVAGHVSIGSRMMPLIHMLQELAMPVGIVVSLWGLIEMIMGNIDSGKHKLKWSIIGFVGMFLIPEVFYTIKAVFGGA